MNESLGQQTANISPAPFQMSAKTIRGTLKEAAQAVFDLRNAVARGQVQMQIVSESGEMIANLMLAYRHLEDASMRLGKAIQAYDGGVSCYDRTAVGAPETVPAPAIPDWQARVIAEKAELDGRISKLRNFLASPPRNLNQAQITLLQTQSEVMDQYSQVLGSRIAQFSTAPAPAAACPADHPHEIIEHRQPQDTLDQQPPAGQLPTASQVTPTQSELANRY